MLALRPGGEANERVFSAVHFAYLHGQLALRTPGIIAGKKDHDQNSIQPAIITFTRNAHTHTRTKHNCTNFVPYKQPANRFRANWGY